MASYLHQRCIHFLALIWLCHQTHTACGGTKVNEALLQILVRVGVNKLISGSALPGYLDPQTRIKQIAGKASLGSYKVFHMNVLLGQKRWLCCPSI